MDKSAAKQSIRVDEGTKARIEKVQRGIILQGMSQVPERIKNAFDVSGGALPAGSVVSAGCEALLMLLEGALEENVNVVVAEEGMPDEEDQKEQPDE